MGYLPHRTFTSAALALAMIAGALVALVQAPAAATARPPVTRSWYEHEPSVSRLYWQGCYEGHLHVGGVVILDWGRPAFRPYPAAYGTIDYDGHFDTNVAILAAMKAFANGYWNCSSRGLFLSVAWGTNNSCSNNDPRCCPRRHCKLQPKSFATAGNHWDGYVDMLAQYIRAKGFGSQLASTGADDLEPAWEPRYTHSHDFVTGYNTGSPLHALWDFGSLEDGYWTRGQEYYLAFGSKASSPFPEIYFTANTYQWANLSLWAVYNRGGQMTIHGVMTEYRSPYHCGYKPDGAYDALLRALNAHSSTAQSEIPFRTNLPCYTS